MRLNGNVKYMTYLEKKYEREYLNSIVDIYGDVLIKKGAISYLLYLIAKRTCDDFESYTKIIGELECVKMEIYRRQIAVFQNKEKNKNGDIKKHGV